MTAPWGNWLNTGDPNAGTAVPYSGPVPPKQSILDRLMGRLFPASALLDPGTAQTVQRQGLLQLGTNLLQAGGAAPMQRGTLANIGASIGGVDINELTKNALAMQEYQRSLAAQRQVANVVAAHPASPGETPTQTHDRLAQLVGQLAGIPEALPIVEKLGPIITALKPAANKWSFQTVEENGQPVLYRVNEDTGDKYRVGLGKSKEATPQERVAGSQLTSATTSVARMRQIAQTNRPAVQAAVAAIKAGGWGKLGKAYSEARGFLNDKDAQDFYTEYKNMILAVTPTYGASRPTQQLMDLEQAATLPALGSGDFETAFGHMDQRLQDIRAKAGKAAPVTPGVPPGEYSADNPFKTLYRHKEGIP